MELCLDFSRVSSRPATRAGRRRSFLSRPRTSRCGVRIAVRSRRPDRRGGSGGELPDLDVHPTVDLLALLARVVTEGTVLPDGDDLDRGVRDAELDQKLLDGLRAPERQ